MINPDLKGGGKIEVFDGGFYIPDFEDPKYHDGSLVHYSHLVTTAQEMDLHPKIGGRAANTLIRSSVILADDDRMKSIFKMEPVGARGIDWRYNFAHPGTPESVQKRLRIFLTNNVAANAFYDHVVRTSSDWPSRYLDVIEALLKSRGYDRPSEKRTAQLARRESQT